MESLLAVFRETIVGGKRANAHYASLKAEFSSEPPIAPGEHIAEPMLIK